MNNRIVSILLAVVLVLSVGLISCTAEYVPEIPEYNLTISSTEGGEVTSPGEGAHIHEEGEVVNLVAEAEEGYQFIDWTGDVSTIADVNAASTTITMSGGYSIIANFAGAIRDWYDLDAIRSNLDGSYILMNDLDSATAGYVELASPTANGGKGWQPIGGLLVDPSYLYLVVSAVAPFIGSLDGQGYEIRDMFINHPNEDGVGLFGSISAGGVVKNLGMINVDMAGRWYVGGLVGQNIEGTVHSSYSTGSVTGDHEVGGLVGWMGWKGGTVNNSYSTSSVIGEAQVGGLVGWNSGTVSNSYAVGSVTGDVNFGGLVGLDDRFVSNSFWDTETSGQATSAGGIGKTMTEMKKIATFSSAGWNITTVVPGKRNPSYIWNIVDGQTYPFLSWQPVL